MYKKYRYIYLFFVLMLAAGCVGKNDLSDALPRPEPATHENQVGGPENGSGRIQNDLAARIWLAYLASAQGDTPKPFRLEGSLRYSPPKGNGNRLSFYLWSNGGKPYRLDATAGFSSLVVAAREGENEFSAYVPEEAKLYEHKGWQTPRFVLPGLGQPLPVSIGDIAALLEGRCTRLFDREYSLAAPVEPGTYLELDEAFGRNFEGHVYTLLRGPLVGELILTADAHPVFWKGSDGWSMLMEPEKDDLKVRKLTISHEEGYKAIILVKNREYPAVFSDAQLTLLTPSGTEVLPIKRMK